MSRPRDHRRIAGVGGIHVVVWLSVGLGIWTLMRSTGCDGLCAVAGALQAYVLIGLGTAISALAAICQIVALLRRNGVSPNR